MASTTTNLYPQDGFQIQRSAWEALMLNYLLLPALCAIFLFIVVLIIAFVFIKKKSPVGGTCPEKSCHTIESFNEVSDVSLYDVINEAHDNGKVTSDTISRTAIETSQDHVSHNKNRGMCSLASCWGIQDNFTRKTVILKSVTSLATSESKCADLTSRININMALDEEANNHSKRASTAMSLQLEGRIYETLDRHWRMKRDTHVTGSTHEHDGSDSPDVLASGSESDSKNMERMTIESRAVDQHMKRSCLEDTPKPSDAFSVFSRSSKDIDTPRSKGLNGTDTTNITDFDHCETPNGQTICKLSFIPFSEASVRAEHSRARTFYYVIQNKANKELTLKTNDDYITFPSTDSVCLHFSPKADDDPRLHGNNGNSHSLNLKPLTNTALIGLFEDAALKEYSPKITDLKKSADQSHLFEASRAKKSSKSTSCKKRLLKKSESFSETGANRPSETVRKFSLGAISFKQGTRPSDGKQYEKMDPLEVARILSKLGPLPPIPRSSNYEAEKLTKLVTSDFEAGASHQDFKSSKGHNPVFTADDKEDSKDWSSGTCIHKDTEEHASRATGVSCGNVTHTRGNNEHAHGHCLEDTNSVMLCHSLTRSGELVNENSASKSSNHYFILEPGQDSKHNSCVYRSDRTLPENSGSVGSEEDVNSYNA